ncbi:MAG: OB-fold nucleic acid binding domain-containing protein, partial [Thermoproteota archaeon]
MPEQELIAARKEKLARLRARGINPYPYSFSRTHTAAELRQAFGHLNPATHTGQGVAVAGRIMALRRMGRATFADLHDRSGKIQIFLTPQTLGPEAYAFWVEHLDLGDLVGVRGEVFTTRTGELSVAAQELVLLAKALRPLPEKWHGL